MGIKFSNLATTSLASGITNSATTITVVDGSVFPALGSGDFFFASIDTPPNAPEIVKVTAISSNTLTVVRGQDGTTATSHNSSETIALRVVAAALEDLRDNAGETYTAGSGITLTGTTFSNSAPDQTVSLTGSGATSVSGTYPNFTITSTDTNTDTNTTYTAGSGITLTGTVFSNSAPDQTVALTGSGGTTVSGTYPNFTISSAASIDGTTINPSSVQIGGTTVIDSSRNLTNIGTITATGDIIANGLEVGTAYGSDSQYLGIKRAAAGSNDYLLMQGSGGDAGNTYLSAGAGKTVHIRGDANNTTNQLIVASSGTTIGGNTAWHAGNDGSGSGLDADLLDGQQGSYYNQSQFTGSAFTSRNNGNPIAIDNVTSNMVGYVNSSSAAGYSDGAGFSAAYSSSWVGQLFIDFRTGKLSTRGKNNGTWQSHRFMWDNLNDGSGSGLDADTVDGVQGSSLVRSDASDTMSGTYTFTGGHGAINITNSSILSSASSNWTGNPGGLGKIQYHANRWYIVGDSSSGMLVQFRRDGSDKSYIDNNGTLVGGGMWSSYNDGSGSGLDADLLDGTTWATLNKLVGGTSFDVDAGNLNGLRFWNGSGSYRISMSAHNASGAGRVSGETTSDYNMYFKMDGGTNRGFVFQSGTSNRAGIDAAGNIRTVANVDCSYLRADRIYSNNDGSSGYFYNDTSTRTAYAGGEFYIQTSVPNYYNYATNQYIGNSSGNNIYFRSNPISGTGWDITGAGRLTTRDHRINAGYHLQRLDHHSGHMEGSYNSVGANDSKSNPIYTIGSSYNPASTTLSNMYGIGFTHTNASFITIAGSSGWGMYVASAGYARVYLSGQSGSGHFTGNITAYASDRRLKTRIQTIDSALEKVTRIRGVEFDWVDDITSEYDFHPQQMHETGVIAQEIQAVIPDAVVEAPMNGNYTAKCGTDHKFLTVDKEKIVPLLIEAIKELKSEVDALKSQLEEKP